MSDTKKLAIEVELKPNKSSVQKTSQEIGKQLEDQVKQFGEKTKQYIDELNKYKIAVDYKANEQIFLNSSKVSTENDEKSLNFFKETYQQRLDFAKESERVAQEQTDNKKTIDQQKYLNKHYADEQKKYDAYIKQTKKIAQEKEKIEDESIKSTFKKTIDTRNQSDKDQKNRWVYKTKELEQHERDKGDIKKRFKYYGAGIGAAVGGGVGGRVGGAAGAFIGASITGGDIAGGAIGLAITALTAAITHLTDVIEENTGVGYLAHAINADPNQLNAMVKAGERIHLTKEQTLGGVNKIATGIAGLDIQPNGTFGRQTPEGIELARNLHKLNIPLMSKGKVRSPLDIYMDLIRSPVDNEIFKKDGITKDEANVIVSRYLDKDYTTMAQLQSDKFKNDTLEIMKTMPVDEQEIARSQADYSSGIAKKQGIGYTTGTQLHSKGHDVIDKSGNFINKLGGWNYYGVVPNNHKYNSPEDFLFSPIGRGNQVHAESKGKANMIHINKDGSIDVGLYQVNLKTANSPASIANFGHGISLEQLKDPKTNAMYRDFIVKEGLAHIRNKYPELAKNPNTLLNAELVYYNRGEEGLKELNSTGHSKNQKYASGIINNIYINVDARGNNNAKQIADETHKKLVPYNSQTSVK